MTIERIGRIVAYLLLVIAFLFFLGKLGYWGEMLG